MKSRYEAYVSFDIDGVLVDCQTRLFSCIDGESINWNCFLDCSRLNLDRPKPRAIGILAFLRERGFKIAITTGRRESMRKCTVEQLNSYGVQFDLLLMREDSDVRPDREVKLDLLRRVKGLVLAHFDDNEDTARFLKRHGFEVVLIR